MADILDKLENTTPASTDKLYLVDDPSGTPADNNVTAGNLITKAHGLSDGIVKVASGIMAEASAGDADSILPTQTSNSGKYLTTDGTNASWAALAGGGDMAAATYDPTSVAGDAFDQDNMNDGTTNKNYTATEKNKLAGIETAADVTDATNVDAAGAVMNSDTSTASMSFVVDEDDMSSNSATKVPTQQSVKAYVDTSVTGLLDFKGSTDCSTNPNYPSASKGDSYVVSVAGKIGGASGKSVDVGDVYLATADNAGGDEATVGTSWTVLEHNLNGALLASNNLSDVASASTSRLHLGLAIGSDVQAYDADLDTIASLTATTDNFIQSKSGAWASRTPTQVTADLDAMVGDSGSGGTKGLVPAPASGDAAAGKYLKADGTWTAPAGGSSIATIIPSFNVLAGSVAVGTNTHYTSTGDTTVYTVPTGKIFALQYIHGLNTNASSNTIGIYFQLASDSTKKYTLATAAAKAQYVATSSAANLVLLEAGDKLIISSTVSGFNASIRGYLADDDCGLVRAKQYINSEGGSLTSGYNTLYTCPSGKRAVGINGDASTATDLIPDYNCMVHRVQESGATVTIVRHVVPSGSSHSDSTITYGSRSISNSASYSRDAVGAPFVLDAGDSFGLDISSGTTDQFYAILLYEYDYTA